MMKSLIFLIAVLILLTATDSVLFAQVDTAWFRRYNGPGNSGDVARALAVDGSGNVYVTGTSNSGTSFDYATIKYAPNGDTLWVRRYDGPGGGNEDAGALAVDGCGSVYVTGSSYSGTFSDYATIKYAPNGDTLWVRRYNGPWNDYDFASALAVDGSGNVYVTGQSYGSGTYIDYATIKYAPNGDTLWVRRYNIPGNSWDYASALAVDGSGNVYVTGSSGIYPNLDYATIKYAANGDTLWVRTYDGPGNAQDRANALAVDASGNVHVTGSSRADSFTVLQDYDYATIKYAPNGDTLWVRRYGPADESVAIALAVDNSGNAYVTGSSGGSATGVDYATIKYAPNGDTLWVRRYNRDHFDQASALALDDSGNVYVTGSSSFGCTRDCDYVYATIKYSPNGDSLWVTSYDEPGNDFAYALAVDGSGNVYVTGVSGVFGPFATSGDYATFKYVQIPVSVVKTNDYLPERFCLEQNHPNPFNPSTVISFQLPVSSFATLKVYNVLGQEVATLVNAEMKPGSHEVTWDATGLPSGVYFYRLQAGSFAETRKLVLLR
ncbi:MAG: SBBP repeat-containing protein [Ignavibacteriae bacterium]|nr:SBBP repeat-containing protein [Ignavibacteriota bacterium]